MPPCRYSTVERLWRWAASASSFGTVRAVGDEGALWICELCGYVYDPAEGDVDGGIAPGQGFEDIPDNWFCPVCGARKDDFSPLDD
jgi:rubredoxin